MNDSGRDQFIQTVRMALGRDESRQRTLDDIIGRRPQADDAERLEIIAGRNRDSRLILLERLTKKAALVNVGVLVTKDGPAAMDAIVAIAAARSAEWGSRKSVVAWDHPLVNHLALPAALEPLGIPVSFPEDEPATAEPRQRLRHHAETAFIGITSADYCIAETATLTMKTRPGQPRFVSLLPSIHIAVVRLEQILADLNEFYTLMRWHPEEQAEGITRCMTLITGPSKTADIEATLVHGAHGPRELHIVVLTD